MKEYAYIHEDGQLPAPLKAVPFLNSFSDEQLEEVLNSSSLLQCDPGDFIIREGSIDSRIYVLLSGELEVRVAGKPVTTISRPGDVFGELALVNQDKRAASVIAKGRAALCLAVDQKFLQDMHPREEDPDFHASLFEFVARLVTKKLEATSRRLGEVEKELAELKAKNPEATTKASAAANSRKPTQKKKAKSSAKPTKTSTKPQPKSKAKSGAKTALKKVVSKAPSKPKKTTKKAVSMASKRKR